MTYLSHALYPPDLAQWGIFVSQMKKGMEGHRLKDVVEQKIKKTQELAAILIDKIERCFPTMEC